MSCIFNREQFRLCKVPVPKGYPQSQTHCGIICVGGVCYMTTSPYPNPRRPLLLLYFLLFLRKVTFRLFDPFYRGEDFENPCIYTSDDTNKIGFPTSFKMMEGSPLMSKPIDKYGLGSYCSDPDISYKDGLFYILNRTSFRKGKTGISEKDYETHSFLIIGKEYNKKIQVLNILHLFEENDVSPCMLYFKGRFIYFSLISSSYNDGKPCKALYMRESKCPTDNSWGYKQVISIEKGQYEPWHISVFEYNNHLYAIIACVKQGEKQRCWQMLGEFSEDLTRLIIYQTPLTDYKSYRGSAFVTQQGEFVLYTTTMNEHIRKGNSVDGREIIMAHMSFQKLL